MKRVYPLDNAFSEKALIIDIQGESGEASQETSVEESSGS
jgi:hypothetical protein